MSLPTSENYTPSFKDPFTAAHAALWAVVESDPQLVGIVGVKNRVHTENDTYKAPRSPAGVGDVPEFMISQAAFAYPPCKPNMDQIVATQDFTILCTTDRINWSVANFLKHRLHARMWEAGFALGTGCLINGWILDGSDALSANQPADPQRPPSEYRATVIGRVRIFINLTRARVVDPNAMY